MCYNLLMSDPALSVIMVSYNTCAVLRQALRSVFASSTSFPFAVWVVDNASQDGSAEMVANEFQPQHANLHLIRSPRNGGFSYGNNLALSEFSAAGRATGQPGAVANIVSKYVLLLNPDTILPPDALAAMVAFMDAHPQAGIAGPKMVRPNGQLDLACRRGFPTPLNSIYKLAGLSKLFPHSRRFASYNMTFADPDTLTEVDAVMGAFMLLRAEAINQVGLMDDSFFMYGEDLDWAYRIKQHGWQVYYNPAVRVIHYKGESTRRSSYRMIIQFYRSMSIFHHKHYAGTTFFLLNWLIAIGIWGKAGLALVQNLLRPSSRKRVAL